MRNRGAIALIAVLVLSLLGIRYLPFHSFWGLDLHNLFVFHRCGLAYDEVYRVAGSACGDAGDRAMLYPPLLYWSFVWLKALGFSQAVVLWSVLIACGVPWVLARWRGAAPRVLSDWVWIALLSFQFPTIFSIERGNSDILVLLLWFALWRWLESGRDVQWKWPVAGVLAGAAAALKLYPAFAAVVLFCGIPGLKDRLRYAAGGVFTVAVLLGMFHGESLQYFTQVLPGFMQFVPPSLPFSHSLQSLHGAMAGKLAGYALVAVWAYAAFRYFKIAPEWLVAGALAISTYQAGVSYDYNHLTALPLLFLVVRRITLPLGREALAHVFVGVAAFFLLRALDAEAGRLAPTLQWGWLMWTALRLPYLSREYAAKIA